MTRPLKDGTPSITRAKMLVGFVWVSSSSQTLIKMQETRKAKKLWIPPNTLMKKQICNGSALITEQLTRLEHVSKKESQIESLGSMQI